MTINLTPKQKRFIEAKVQSGNYRSTEEVLEMALHLLDGYDRAYAELLKGARGEDAATSASNYTPPMNAETFVNKILEQLSLGNSTKKF